MESGEGIERIAVEGLYGVHYSKWNPVKELKELIRRKLYIEEHVEQVESGEGIERVETDLPVLDLHHYVESGEGIESSRWRSRPCSAGPLRGIR